MKFKEAIKQMLESGEFEKIINNADKKEAAVASKYYEAIQKEGIDNIPTIPLLMGCESVEVLKDAIMFMEREGN